MENEHPPQEILLKSAEVIKTLIPEKSAERYGNEYQIFSEWKTEHNIKKIDEDVMLAYILDLSKKVSSSSLWSKYSMVKSMLLVYENLNISHFSKVTAFLKKQSVGYQPTQSMVLTREEVNRFMIEARNKEYLLLKVITIFGVAGDCRREELHNIIHTIGGTPKKIAEFLKLKNPEKYTGHCFRRTSATLLANAGADLTVLKKHGGWKSSSVAEKYIEDSIETKQSRSYDTRWRKFCRCTTTAG